MHILERLAGLEPERRAAVLRLLRTRGEEYNVFPLSFAQRRLWFLNELYGDSSLYNVPYAFWLTGELDTGAMQRALQAAVVRHEVLRTVYIDIEGEPYQVILPPSAQLMPFTTRTWREEDADRPALLRRILDVEAARPFDLRTGPVVRSMVLSAGRRHLFLLTLHHIACDGWSMGVLFQDLEKLYTAEHAGREADLPPLALRYVDYAKWQARELAGPTRDRQLAYWKEHLAGAPAVLEFPDRPPKAAGTIPQGAMVDVRWEGAVATALAEYSRREAVTPYVTTLAAWAAVLHRRTGLPDIIVGTPFSNRGRSELEPLVGFFVNPLPLRMRVSGDATFHQLVRQARDVSLGAQANQDLPFEMLVEAMGQQRDLAHHPLYQVAFTMQDQGFEALHLPDLEVRLLRGHGGTAKYDLTGAFVLTAAALQGEVEYDATRFGRQEMLDLLDEFCRTLVGGMAEPNRRIDELSLESSAGAPS